MRISENNRVNTKLDHKIVLICFKLCLKYIRRFSVEIRFSEVKNYFRWKHPGDAIGENPPKFKAGNKVKRVSAETPGGGNNKQRRRKGASNISQEIST